MVKQDHDVSVIIPTHNRLNFLRQALASVLAQTLPPKEIFIIDDGSDDGTWDWLQSQSVESLRCLRQTQQGPAAARNRGLAEASGKFIAFLDSDDAWLPQKLEVQRDFLLQNPDYKICQTEEIWIRRGVRVNPRKKHQKPSGEVFGACLKLCLISPSAVMIEGDFLRALGGFDETFPVCEDYELWLRASLRAKVKTLTQPLTIKHGGHDDQLSHRHPAMDRFRVRAMEKTLEREALNLEQRKLLLAELQVKLNILAKGFEKHHPTEQNPYLKRLEI